MVLYRNPNLEHSKETSVILRIHTSAFQSDGLPQSLLVSLFEWNPLFTLILCKDNIQRKVTVQMMDVRRKCSKSVILIMQQAARRRQARHHQWKWQEKVTLIKMHTELSTALPSSWVFILSSLLIFLFSGTFTTFGDKNSFPAWFATSVFCIS